MNFQKRAFDYKALSMGYKAIIVPTSKSEKMTIRGKGWGVRVDAITSRYSIRSSVG